MGTAEADLIVVAGVLALCLLSSTILYFPLGLAAA
jgi:hypothetical protein